MTITLIITAALVIGCLIMVSVISHRRRQRRAGYVLPSLASLTHHRPGAGEIQAIEHHLTCAARQAVSNDLHFTLPAFPKKVITSIVCATASPGMLSWRKTDSSGITTLKATRFICLRFWMNLFRPQMSLM